MSRRAARLTAVEELYGLDLRGEGGGAEGQGQDAYALHLVRGVRGRLTDLDEVIRRYAVGWTPERMSTVDRNILRVAAFELLEDDVPAPAVIDEAVSIAKKLSGEKAGRFVNGVLEAVRQALDEGAGPSGRGGPGSGDPSGRGGSGSGGGGSAAGAV